MMETSIDRNTQPAPGLTKMVLEVERHRDAMRSEHVPCDRCGAARATMLTRSREHGDRRVCVDCSRTARTPGTTRQAPIPAAGPVHPSVAAARERLRRAERDEPIHAPVRQRPLSSYNFPDADNYKRPKAVTTWER